MPTAIHISNMLALIWHILLYRNVFTALIYPFMAYGLKMPIEREFFYWAILDLSAISYFDIKSSDLVDLMDELLKGLRRPQICSRNLVFYPYTTALFTSSLFRLAIGNIKIMCIQCQIILRDAHKRLVA